MLNKLLIIIFLNSATFSAMSEEITVFYNHDDVIKDASLVKNNGHTLLYLQMDLLEQLQEELSSRATSTHQVLFMKIVKKYGEEKLKSMSDEDRTRLFMSEFKNNGIDLRQAEMNPKDIAAVKNAVKILEYANSQEVTLDMLPAVIYQGNLYRNVTSFSFLFRKRSQ